LEEVETPTISALDRLESVRTTETGALEIPTV